MIEIWKRNIWILLLLIEIIACKGDDEPPGTPPDPTDLEICGNDEEYNSLLLPCYNGFLAGYKNIFSLNPVFNNSEIIYVPKYSYNYLGSYYTVDCDESLIKLSDYKSCCEIVAEIDVTSVQPVFEWNSIQNSLLAVAIFKNQIRLTPDGRRISNTNDIIWTWNSGMNTGTQVSGKTRIEYIDGKMVYSGAITDSPVVSLTPGNIYSWFVWAWDSDGTTIIFSSREIPFIVQEIAEIPINTVRQIEGAWKIVHATSLSGQDTIDNFPINKIYFERYCNRDSKAWSNKYCINNSSDSSLLYFSTDTIYLSGDTIINKFFNLRMNCDEEFNAKCVFENDKVLIEFQR